MRTSRRLSCALGILFLASVSAQAAPPQAVQRALLDFEKDYIATIGDAESEIKVGATVDLVPLSGNRVKDVEIVEIQPGKAKHTFRSLSFKGPKGPRKKFAGNLLLQLQAGNRQFECVLEPSSKTYVLLDGDMRDQISAGRLAAQRRALWTEPTPAEAQSTVQELKDLFAKVSATYPTSSFTLHETAFFLFYTDIPAEQVGVYIANLDAMYQRLCQMFSVPLDKNIWRGKCAIVAFADKEPFRQFEAQIMKSPLTENYSCIYHAHAEGRVVISCYRGKDPLLFAAMLVQTTSHGFLHRFRSNVHIPSWIGSGIADWVADVVVPAYDGIKKKQAKSVQQMRSTGSMGGDFFDHDYKLPREQFGVASSLTNFMLTQNPSRYNALLTAIKEGYTWEEGLKLTYGITPTELAQEFGRSIGVPGLRP